ncbi:MAG: lysophospholipid acyltransferase family protein [Prevotellaceae bacterium]|jgi:KDO2-lipid IV(A) lauroyltransferase|nr:lysophospholipid acyltransferase family protein [Prevotellaceae bacterium]
MKKISKSTLRRETVLLLVYPLFVITMLFLWLLPTCLRARLEQFAGRMYYEKGIKARKIALENLTSVFSKEKSVEEIELLARQVFTNTAGSFLDFFAQVYINNPKTFFKKIVSVEGEQNLQQAFSKGKGVICLIPHLSSWELSAVIPPMLGYKTIAASKPIKGFLVNASMVWFRKRRGMINFDRTGSYQNLVQGLNEGNCLILMIDQDTNVKGCFVDFFGRQTYTPLGASRLAADTGAAIVPMATFREGTGKYRFEIMPELPFVQTQNLENDLIANTQAQTLAMENFIRKSPSQWVWMHRRWKTTPESLARFLEKRRLQKEK